MSIVDGRHNLLNLSIKFVLKEKSLVAVQTVSEYTSKLKLKIDKTMPSSWIKGEISNLALPASRHIYFVLKDEYSQIRCVFFRHKQSALSPKLTDGIEVDILAVPSLYGPKGELQLLVHTVRYSGQGELYKKFTQLKARLKDEGLFEKSLRKSIPIFPKLVALVTSEQGAAIKDVLATFRKRMPSIKLVVFPTKVQGEGAERDLLRALDRANNYGGVDAIIICRGGGSFEDLWCFNDEKLARAVSSCKIPTVTGIGHESDFTILDFVADFRAPTPTAAAVALAPDRVLLNDKLNRIRANLVRIFNREILGRMQAVDFISQRLRSPQDEIQKNREKLKVINRLILSQMINRIDSKKNLLSYISKIFKNQNSFSRGARDRLNELGGDFREAWLSSIRNRIDKLQRISDKFSALNISALFKRGFSIIQDEEGKILKSTSEVQKGKHVSLIFIDGTVRAKVEKIQAVSKIRDQ